MKKYFSFLTIAALGVLAISCAKEVEFNNKENTGKSISMVFSATLETDDDATKTALQDDNKVNWSKDDQILAVWDGGSKESEALTEGGASASFTVNDMEGNPQYAVYPSTLTSSYDGASFKVTIPSTQDGSFSKAAVEVAQVSDSDLAFKNLGGLMKLTITSADVRTVTISSNDGTALAGKATVTFDTAGVPSVASVEEGTSTVTLSFTGEPSTEEPYYVAVLPCELKAGVYIEFKDVDGYVIGEKMTGKTLSVARRQICNFGSVTIATIENKYFVTVEGNGDGSSWENAADYAALVTHLKQDKVNGKNIYMAAGTYTSTAAVTISNTSFSIFGGYPADAKGTSLAGRNITANETVFDGNDTYSIYTFSSSDIDGSFDGVTFTKGARRDNNKAGCALVIANVKKLSCANCKFTSNVTTSGSGGVMRADAGTLVFSKCTFSNNSANAGGVVYAGYTYSSFPSITFNECSFNNNSSTAGAGGVLCVAGKSGYSPTIAFTKCSFSGNSSSGNGGVINATGVKTCPTTITVTGCQFNNNTSSAYASVICLDNYATVNIDGSYFGGNNANARGAIRLSNANSIVRINNSSFRDNTSSNICTDILVTNGILAVNNCSFSHSASRNIPAIQNSAKALIVNSSLQGGVNTEKGIINNGSADASLTLANNIILNTNDGDKPAVTNPNSGTVTSCGYNAYYYSLPSTEEGDFLTDKGYRLGWNDTDKILWKSNNMFPYGPNKTAENPDPMPKGTPAKVLEAIQAFDTANLTAGVETWLNGAYLKDALGTTRNTEGCWPGAYEGK